MVPIKSAISLGVFAPPKPPGAGAGRGRWHGAHLKFHELEDALDLPPERLVLLRGVRRHGALEWRESPRHGTYAFEGERFGEDGLDTDC